METRRATFTGDCTHCFDEGYVMGAINTPCPYCLAGVDLRIKQQEERAAREDERRRDRLVAVLQTARLPERCRGFTLETFPRRELPAYHAVREFLEGWDGRRGLVLTGAYGVGKTGLAVGLMRAIAERWALSTAVAVAAADAGDTRRMLFLTATDLLDELRQGFEDGSYSRRLTQAKTIGLLTIDDLGAEKPTEWVVERMFAVLNTRYEWQLPTFVTTNYGMGQLIGRVGERVVERLMEACTLVRVTGDNLRMARDGGGASGMWEGQS